jgi:hypothetical protein
MDFPPLTAEFCLHVAINASPFPSRFKPGDDPTVKTLFDLGVATATDSAFYAQAVKNRIAPWHIDTSAIASSPGTTVQAAADSIQIGAFKE